MQMVANMVQGYHRLRFKLIIITPLVDGTVLQCTWCNKHVTHPEFAGHMTTSLDSHVGGLFHSSFSHSIILLCVIEFAQLIYSLNYSSLYN